MFTSEKFNNIFLPHNAVLRDALTCITHGGCLLALKVGPDNTLQGIVTDNDVRRALLRGHSLDSPVECALNNDPFVAKTDSDIQALVSMALESGKHEIPIINSQFQVQGVFLLGTGIVRPSQDKHLEVIPIAIPRKNEVTSSLFILAGGLGTRLRPLISDRPKPLAEVGGRALIEILLEQAVSSGFKHVFVSVNFMADAVESFVREKFSKSLDITIVSENKRLGTAGSIGYVAQSIKTPLVVCNADLITNLPLDKVLSEHLRTGAQITTVVRPWEFSVPYGVVKLDRERVKEIQEKPNMSFLVNCGIYVLNPSVCESIPFGQYLDMPDLIRSCLRQGDVVHPFYMHEYWIDVGTPADFAQANLDLRHGRIPSRVIENFDVTLGS